MKFMSPNSYIQQLLPKYFRLSIMKIEREE